jgi:DNA-binding NarL/FixJ family response regulator
MVNVGIMSSSAARLDWLKRAVAGERDIRVVGVAPTFPFLRSLISETPADLALIDLDSRIDSTTRGWLNELGELVPLLVLSFERDAAMLNFMLSEKTGGILSADASSEQIIQAIKSIASGLIVFDGDFVSGETSDHPLVESLTPRESEVLALLADGLGNKEIAQRLNISEHTIKFHIRSILAKLGASTRTEAVSLGLRSGLIEL